MPPQRFSYVPVGSVGPCPRARRSAKESQPRIHQPRLLRADQCRTHDFDQSGLPYGYGEACGVADPVPSIRYYRSKHGVLTLHTPDGVARANAVIDLVPVLADPWFHADRASAWLGIKAARRGERDQCYGREASHVLRTFDLLVWFHADARLVEAFRKRWRTGRLGW